MPDANDLAQGIRELVEGLPRLHTGILLSGQSVRNHRTTGSVNAGNLTTAFESDCPRCAGEKALRALGWQVVDWLLAGQASTQTRAPECIYTRRQTT